MKKVHPCAFCSKTFTSTYKLKSHLFHHKAIAARFKCLLCLKEYYRKDEYTKHVATHNNQQKTHICDHCGRGFVDKRNLINHLSIHDDLHVPVKRFNCIACDMSYCEERILKYHIRKHHMNLEAQIPSYTDKMLNDSWIEPSLDSKSCVQITKVTNNKISIQTCNIKAEKVIKPEMEKKTLVNKRKFKSVEIEEKINKSATYLSSIFALSAKHYSKAICDYCKKEMLKKSLINHIRERHLKVRRFHCFDCMKSFNRHYHLSDHICGQVRRSKHNSILKIKN